MAVTAKTMKKAAQLGHYHFLQKYFNQALYRCFY